MEPGRQRAPRAAASLALGLAGLLLCFVGLPALVLGGGAVVVGAAALLHLRHHPERYGVSFAAAGILAGALAIVLAAAFIAAVDEGPARAAVAGARNPEKISGQVLPLTHRS